MFQPFCFNHIITDLSFMYNAHYLASLSTLAWPRCTTCVGHLGWLFKLNLPFLCYIISLFEYNTKTTIHLSDGG